MNRKIKKTLFSAAFAVSMIMCMSTNVSAISDGDYGIPVRTYVLIYSLPILIGIVILFVMYKLHKSGYDVFRTGQNDKFNTLFRENHPEGLSTDEQVMLEKLKADLKSKKPDPVMIKCPNCGASLSISDKVTCPYCHSEITNRTVVNAEVKRHEVVMTDENINPMRYYEENVTGYKKLDADNEAGQRNRSGRSGSYSAPGARNRDFDSSFSFRSSDDHKV